jgi:hypothetical protein
VHNIPADVDLEVDMDRAASIPTRVDRAERRGAIGVAELDAPQERPRVGGCLRLPDGSAGARLTNPE